ncbi:hypothetical protein PSYPI_18376, partial [Pseudomonas syringae pv. pisi str. 1704B]
AVLRDPEPVAGLACRRLGHGLGVAVRPEALAELLGMPDGAKPLATYVWARSRNFILRQCW